MKRSLLTGFVIQIEELTEICKILQKRTKATYKNKNEREIKTVALLLDNIQKEYKSQSCLSLMNT